LIIEDLFSLGYLPVREVGFFPTENSEFYITLSRQGTGRGLSRLEMLRDIEIELMTAMPSFALASSISERKSYKLTQNGGLSK
jgi:hypothetical protein